MSGLLTPNQLSLLCLVPFVFPLITLTFCVVFVDLECIYNYSFWKGNGWHEILLEYLLFYVVAGALHLEMNHNTWLALGCQESGLFLFCVCCSNIMNSLCLGTQWILFHILPLVHGTLFLLGSHSVVVVRVYLVATTCTSLSLALLSHILILFSILFTVFFAFYL